MSQRAVPRVRKILGQRLRTVRSLRRLSQEALGRRSGLSAKFLGEVERGRKSISVDSLYRVAVALKAPLAFLTDVRSRTPSQEAERVIALVATALSPGDLQRAYDVLRAILEH